MFLLLTAVQMAFSQNVSAAPAQQNISGPSDSALLQAKIDRIAKSSSTATTLGSVSVNTGKSESIAMLLVRITISLLILSMLVVAVLWLMKKAGLSGSSRLGGGASMDVIEVLPLGQNRNIMLVRLLDKVLVVAQTATHTVLLDTIEGQRAIELIAGRSEGPTMAQFKDVFGNFIDKLKKQEPQKLS